MSETPLPPDVQLADELLRFNGHPLEFVQYNYQWGKGDLVNFTGPDDWATGFLKEWGEEIRRRGFNGSAPVEPIRFSVVSGHGIGKSALTGWISDFIRSTRPHSKGIVTANSSPQLETKTWAEIVKCHKRSITRDWFRATSGRGAMKITNKLHPERWRMDGMAWREHQPEAFAGLHAVESTPYYIFDEASAIARIIFETAEGGMTDGEPMIFLFGNGTKNSGYFYETHNKNRHRWLRYQVDSRKVKITNKALIEQWKDEYGEDSDFFRIRVKGQFPRQSSAQFIATDVVEAARKREIPPVNLQDPIIFGVDSARGGDDFCVLRIRKGLDMRSFPKIRMQVRDLMVWAAMIAKAAEEHLPDAIFVDETGIGAGVVDRLRQLKIPNVIGVNNGARSPSRQYHNMGAYCWGMLRDALKAGAVIEDSDDLQSEMTTREYTFDDQTRFVLESKDDLKERGEASPDDVDAHALTFAAPVGPRNPMKTAHALAGRGFAGSPDNEHDGKMEGDDYDPYKPKD